MADLSAGSLGRVYVRVVSVAGTDASVRVLDNNGQPVTPAATIPVGVIEVMSFPVAVGDVLEHLVSGQTAVVRWVDPADGTRWSERPDGAGARSSEAFTKIGTFTLP